MDMDLEKYTEELLKGYCEKTPSKKKAFSKNINIRILGQSKKSIDVYP